MQQENNEVQSEMQNDWTTEEYDEECSPQKRSVDKKRMTVMIIVAQGIQSDSRCDRVLVLEN